MKKLFLIVAAMFAVVSFSACSDDDNGNPLTEMRYVKEIRSSQGEIESFEYSIEFQNTQDMLARVHSHMMEMP